LALAALAAVLAGPPVLGAAAVRAGAPVAAWWARTSLPAIVAGAPVASFSPVVAGPSFLHLPY